MNKLAFAQAIRILSAPGYRGGSLLFLLVLLVTFTGFVEGAGITSGTTLNAPTSARAAALGDSMSAATDDIAALGYNPASLGSLSQSQLSFLYQKGLAQDSYGNFLYGVPLGKGSLGLAVGYYEGGTFDYFDGTNIRTVQAKQDITSTLGYGVQMGRISLGISGKYISSKLLQTYQATTFAADVGAQVILSRSFLLGAAVQNMGSGLTYAQQTENLPTVGRLGFQWNVPFPLAHITLLADAPYYMHEADFRPSLGLESLVGPLALRVGYQMKGPIEGVSFGAGFMLGNARLDYSYGLVKNLDAEQRISVSLNFGAPRADLQNLSADSPHSAICFFQTNQSNEVK